MGGLGWGGNSYYALDITDPDHPAHLFTINNDVNNKVINYWDASGKNRLLITTRHVPALIIQSSEVPGHVP